MARWHGRGSKERERRELKQGARRVCRAVDFGPLGAKSLFENPKTVSENLQIQGFTVP